MKSYITLTCAQWIAIRAGLHFRYDPPDSANAIIRQRITDAMNAEYGDDRSRTGVLTVTFSEDDIRMMLDALQLALISAAKLLAWRTQRSYMIVVKAERIEALSTLYTCAAKLEANNGQFDDQDV